MMMMMMIMTAQRHSHCGYACQVSEAAEITLFESSFISCWLFSCFNTSSVMPWCSVLQQVHCKSQVIMMMMMMVVMLNVWRVEMVTSTVWVSHRLASSSSRENRRSACSSGENVSYVLCFIFPCVPLSTLCGAYVSVVSVHSRRQFLLP